MITYEDAKAIINEKYPNYLIRSCFKYKGKYVFSISYGLKYYENDPLSTNVSVSMLTGDVEGFSFWSYISDPIFSDAINNPIYTYKKESKNYGTVEK